MKAYVQFLTVNNKILMEAMGSDGVFILDGRNSLRTMIIGIMKRMNKLRHVRSDFIGYRIYKSERFDNKNLCKEWILSGTKYTRRGQ